MLKVKKILEEIIPQTKELPQSRVDAYARSRCDDMIYYDEYGTKGVFYCTKCKNSFVFSGAGDLLCPHCSNDRFRKSTRNSDTGHLFRIIEEIEGFIVLKDIAVSYREDPREGPILTVCDDCCIVIQGEEAGYFECSTREVDDTEEKIWRRVKIKRNSHYYRHSKSVKTVLPYDGAIDENEMVKGVRLMLGNRPLYTIFEELMEMMEKPEEESEDVCPEFEDSLVSHNIDDAQISYGLHRQEEKVSGEVNIRRIHQWCAKCGRYSLDIETRQYNSGTGCKHCKNSGSDFGLNYFISPQELDDGRMLLKIEECYVRRVTEGKHIIGEDKEPVTHLQLDRTEYVLLDLQGKAHLYDENGKPINRLSIKVKKYDYHRAKFLYSDEQRDLILNNTAVKRTGFVEFYNRTQSMNMRYFNAMQVSPYIEMFSKMGLSCLVDDIMFEDDESKLPAYLKKVDAKCPFKKLTKPQMREIIEHDCRLERFIQYLQVFKKDPLVSYTDFDWLASHSNARLVLDALRVEVPGLSVKKMQEYITHVDDAQCCRPEESVQLWADYLRMLKNLDCDLTDSALVYPNSLKREHDKASRKLSQVKDEKLAKRFRERAGENEWCTWENNDFCVLVPTDITDLYEEGRKLHHCVGTYGRMVADGSCTIAFVRRKDMSDVPFCTIEIRDKRVVQARGVSNRPAMAIPKVRGFMEQWSKARGLTLEVA